MLAAATLRSLRTGFVRVSLALFGLASTTHAHAQTFDGRMSGTWWNPERNGEGQFITFESSGGQPLAVLAYFTYDDEGRAQWLVGSGAYAAGARTVTIPLIRAEGARFGNGFRSEDVLTEDAGAATLEYIGCNALRMRYDGEVTFSVDLVRTVGPLTGELACVDQPATPQAIDLQLKSLIEREGLTGDPSAGRVVPGIDAPLAQLGKLLFFSKSLSAGLDVACASCHHPALGGGDGLALSIGTGASNPDLVGPGRRRGDAQILVGRNANTFFNTVLYDRGLFWDSRVESLNGAAGANGAAAGIRTPDSALGAADPKAGPNLLAAQARFPVVGPAEMLGTGFAGLDDDAIRAHLAARIGDYASGRGQLAASTWLERFRLAFASTDSAETLITFDNIARALAEYQRSALFVESPWSRYVRGDLNALSSDAKLGALLFFRDTEEGGAQCVQCHSGDRFTDEKHHVLGFPQVGPGLGDPGSDDFGRARETTNANDRYRFRTPSLLNISVSAPYGHAGSYTNLDTVFSHYAVPAQTVRDIINGRNWCFQPPFNAQTNCAASAGTVEINTEAALARMSAVRAATPADGMPVINLDAVPIQAIGQMSAFLRSLTDPCVQDRACFGRWIPRADEAPDQHQLNAVDRLGNPL